MGKKTDKPGDVANNAESTEKKLGGVTGKGFKPGQSGNPTGRPKKKPLTELYEQMLNDPELTPVIRKAVKSAISKGQMAMVLQLREMAERVEGKVTQPVEVDINLSLSERMQRARERRAGA